MESSGFSVEKAHHKKNDSFHSLCDDRELSDEDSSKSQFQKLIKRSNSHHAIVVNVIQSQISKVCFKDLFFRRVHGLDKRIPKHMVSVDEKYLRRCLEFVHISALKATQCSIPSSLSATNEGILSENLITAKLFGGSGKLVFECPAMTETERVAISADAEEQWTPGTVMRSKSMVSILNSALLQQFGVSHRNDNLNSLNFIDAKGSVCDDFIDSSSDLSISSSYKETPLVKGHKYGSISSIADSTCFDWLSSPSSTLSQGMIQCTWEHGVPRFVFCADDQKEVYVSKLRKVDSAEDKSLDYVYEFHLKKQGQKGREIRNNGQLVGKMNVSTSFTVCPKKCRIIETQFTLFGNTEVNDQEVHASSDSHKKNKGLSKKMSQVFRTSPSLRHRTLSKFHTSESHVLADTNFLDSNVPSNFELNAIVVKEHLPCKKLEKVGGWGLNFLNKPRVNQSTLPTESCSRNTGDCSTSTVVIIPAGLHGGPRTRSGGPSSLIDRWKSEGHCDCGGWDEGCPLTILQRRYSEAEVLSQVDTQGQCKTVDIVTQGSSNFRPTLRMENVRDGLYFVHFRLPLSALQSFSIAVAIIHAQCPSLRPDAAQEL